MKKRSLQGVEITPYRSEGEYLDGRRPESVEFVKTLKEDLSRRDFTINAIAIDPFDDFSELQIFTTPEFFLKKYFVFSLHFLVLLF